jgi:hypothetical protein
VKDLEFRAQVIREQPAVELHGGNVRLKSGGIGQGATFTVQLPLIALYAEPAKNRRHPRAALHQSEPLPEYS